MYLELKIGKQNLVLSLAAIDEVLLICELEEIPNSPEQMLGFLMLEDRPIPVLDPAILLGLPATKRALYSKIIRIHSTNGDYAIIAASIDAHFEISGTQIVAIDPKQSANGCISGLLEIKGRSIPVLDPDRLINESERNIIDFFRNQIQERVSRFTELRNEQRG